MPALDDYGRPLYTHPPTLDEAGLVAFLATQPDIVAAYLFGSMAQGRAAAHSDVDIAVLLNRIPDGVVCDGEILPTGAADRRLALMAEFRRFADREVDVVILNEAPIILQNQVLRYGRRLIESDRRARVDYEVRAGQIYADLKPMYDFQTRDLLQKIKEVGLGGRRKRHHQPAALAG
ncbi:MAG: nucleotidyltransferase domain-containing protein [Chloroflexi bacterium]|nr:nucleotidyltransferase domain-containing protein [Chloroflexota bacterium]